MGRGAKPPKSIEHCPFGACFFLLAFALLACILKVVSIALCVYMQQQMKHKASRQATEKTKNQKKAH